MKKSILCVLLVMALCLCVVLASCKKNPDTPDNPDNGNTSTVLPGEKKGNVYETPDVGGDATVDEPNEQPADGTPRY